MKPLLILGIGNLIMHDEGIGIRVVQELEKTETFPAGVDVIDGATGGYFLLNDVIEYERVIMIDATIDDNPPGTIRVIQPRYSSDYPPLMSCHEFGLKNMIDAMLFLEKMPEIHLIAISVKEIERIGLTLTPAVEAAIPEVIKTVKKLVKQLMSEYNDSKTKLSAYTVG